MKRSKEEITAEIAKVEKARQAASRKEARCIRRLVELHQELEEANEVMQRLAELCSRS
ncbi:MAG: hypothetical protein Q4C48_03355 [Lachnospiraceae bacterium]|nr:hypothetical protein [Lachnospiraceae bacterium]